MENRGPDHFSGNARGLAVGRLDDYKEAFFQWRIGRIENGEAKFWYRSKLIGSGKSWVEGDALCNQWDKAIGGLTYCMDVFRNPQGTPEEKNEYVILTDYGIFGCSIEH